MLLILVPSLQTTHYGVVLGRTSALLCCPTTHLRESDRLPAELKTLFPRDWHPDCSFGKMVQAQCPRDTLELEAARSRPNFCKPTALGHQSGPNLSSAPTGDSQLRHSGCCLLRRIPPSLPGWTGMPSDLSAGRQNQLRVRLTRRCTQGTPRLLSGLFQLHTKPGLWPVLQPSLETLPPPGPLPFSSPYFLSQAPSGCTHLLHRAAQFVLSVFHQFLHLSKHLIERSFLLRVVESRARLRRRPSGRRSRSRGSGNRRCQQHTQQNTPEPLHVCSALAAACVSRNAIKDCRTTPLARPAPPRRSARPQMERDPAPSETQSLLETAVTGTRLQPGCPLHSKPPSPVLVPRVSSTLHAHGNPAPGPKNPSLLLLIVDHLPGPGDVSWTTGSSPVPSLLVHLAILLLAPLGP